MPLIGQRMLTGTEPLTSVIEGAKLMAKIAGIGELKTSPASAAERFVITINLGADVEHYDKSVEINPNDIDMGSHNGKVIEQGPQGTTIELVRPPGQRDGS
jgi:hypothetical protein